MWQCHYCHSSLALETLKKNRLCPGCGSDLHCCKNCSFFDENFTAKCKEPDSPWVKDRGVQNSCSYFEHRFSEDCTQPKPKQDEIVSEAEKAKEAFRALFRNLRTAS